MGCYIWYSDEGPGRAAAPPSPLLAVPNVTAHPSTASVPTTYYSMWHTPLHSKRRSSSARIYYAGRPHYALRPSVSLYRVHRKLTLKQKTIQRSNLDERLSTSGEPGRAILRSRGQRSRSLSRKCKKIVLAHFFTKKNMIHVKTRP